MGLGSEVVERLVVLILLVNLIAGVASAGVTQTAASSNVEAGTSIQSDDDTILSGQVVGPNSEPIANATVTIPLAQTSLETRTDMEGQFELSAGDASLPEQAVIVAKKPGYLPQTKLVDIGSSKNRLQLQQGGQRSIIVDSGVTHLGDGQFSGSINSQFQTPVVGEQTSKTFQLNTVQANADDATLRFTARGVQADNVIRVNGVKIGTTKKTPSDGSTIEQTVHVPPRVLQRGGNTVSFEAVETDALVWGFGGGDIDDFEVSNLQIELDGVPRDREKPTSDISVPDAISVGDQGTITVNASDNNRIALTTLTLRHEGTVVETRTAHRSNLSVEALFSEPGTYTVSTQVTDQSGNVHTDEQTFRVGNVFIGTMFTEPTIPHPDGRTDIITVIDSTTNISGTVPVALEINGERVATAELDGLTTGHNGVQWSNVSLNAGSQRLEVKVDPQNEREEIIGTPHLSGDLRVPPLIVDKLYTEPVTADIDEKIMTAGNTHTVAQLTNPLNRTITATFSLQVDGETIEQSRSVTISPNDSQRLLFSWDSQPAESYEIDMEMETSKGSTYQISSGYNRSAQGSISKGVPTETIRVDTNENINFRLWGGKVGNVMVTRDSESEEITSISIPYSAPSEYPISVTIKNMDGDVIGEKQVTATGQYGSVSVPVDIDEKTRYVRIEVEKQGSIRDFTAQLMMGYTGMNAFLSLDDVEQQPGNTYYNSLKYRGVMVAQVSGFPPNDEFVDLQQRVRSKELWKKRGEAAVNVAGVLAGAKADMPSSGARTEALDKTFTTTEFLTAADDNVDLQFDNTDVSMDVSDPQLTNDVAAVSGAEFESKPAYVNPPTHRTAVQYLDVKATGFTDGNAGIEASYNSSEVRQNHLREESMELRYWEDGQWKTADNVRVDTESDTIRADIDVSKLEGTPILIDAEQKSGPIYVINQTLGLSGILLGALVTIFVFAGILYRRYET